MSASYYEHIKVVQELIDSGADINAKNNEMK